MYLLRSQHQFFAPIKFCRIRVLSAHVFRHLSCGKLGFTDIPKISREMNCLTCYNIKHNKWIKSLYVSNFNLYEIIISEYDLFVFIYIQISILHNWPIDVIMEKIVHAPHYACHYKICMCLSPALNIFLHWQGHSLIPLKCKL